MYYVYILANITGTVVYIGVTNNLIRRVYEHKHNVDPHSFTAKYAVHKLVFFEETNSRYAAISREKQIKAWKRRKKNELVETKNPTWEDLYDSLL